LNSGEPLVIHFIMGVARVPRGFDRVASIRATRRNQAITLESAGGQKVEVNANVGFLDAGAIR
jgi:hypothetical protein